MRLVLLPLMLLIACDVPEDEQVDPSDPDTEEPDAEEPDTEEPIEAGSETVTTSWDVSLFDLYESPTIETFDTLDGRRQLDKMTIAIDHTADITLALENGSPFPVNEGDYELQFYFNTLTQLGAAPEYEYDPDEIPEEEDADVEEPPFFGPGGFAAVVSVDLAAGDGNPLGGGDQVFEEITQTINFEADYDPVDTPDYLEAMTDKGEITVVVGGFTETFLNWNEDFGGDGVIFAGPSAIQYSGTMTVTYEYSPTE